MHRVWRMHENRGIALLEVLLASLILASGLVGLASIFAVTTVVNLRNQQRTEATLLLHDKIEQVRTTAGPAGGSLDPIAPTIGFFEYIHIAADGSMTADHSESQAAYLRLWQIQTAGSRTATVAVFGKIGVDRPLELARATTSW